MSYISEQVSYLKGLAEGMKLDDSKNEGKLLLKMIDVLDEISDCLDSMVEEQNEMQLQLDAVDEDLGDLEDWVYDEYEDDDFDYEVYECPNCGEEIYLDEDLLSGEYDSIECPSCGEEIELEFEDDDDDDSWIDED